MTTTEVLLLEDGTEDSETTSEASEDGEEYMTRLSDWKRQRRRWWIDAGLEGYPNMTAALAEEDSDDNRGVCEGRGVDNASEGSETTMEVAAAQQRA